MSECMQLLPCNGIASQGKLGVHGHPVHVLRIGENQMFPDPRFTQGEFY